MPSRIVLTQWINDFDFHTQTLSSCVAYTSGTLNSASPTLRPADAGLHIGRGSLWLGHSWICFLALLVCPELSIQYYTARFTTTSPWTRPDDA